MALVSLVTLFAQRIIYPICIASFILFRPSVIALPYLGLLFWLPHVPVVRRTDALPPLTRCFLQVAICVSAAVLTFQGCVQLAFSQLQLVQRCDHFERKLMQFGLLNVVSSFLPINLLWFLPDVLMLLTSIGMYMWLHSVAGSRKSSEDRTTSRTQQPPSWSAPTSHFRRSFGRYVRNACGMIAMLSGAVMRPSVLGAVYFVAFLGMITWWAFDQRFGRYAIGWPSPYT